MTKYITSIALLLLSLSAFAASDYVCKHKTGDDVYYGHNIVLVEVASKEITVSAYSDMKKSQKYQWIYKVTSNYDLGIRGQIDYPNPLAATLASDIYIINRPGKLFAYVVGTNAGSATTETAVMDCIVHD